MTGYPGCLKGQYFKIHVKYYLCPNIVKINLYICPDIVEINFLPVYMLIRRLLYSRYIQFDSGLIPMLKMLRSSGRMTFLVTNRCIGFGFVVYVSIKKYFYHNQLNSHVGLESAPTCIEIDLQNFLFVWFSYV